MFEKKEETERGIEGQPNTQRSVNFSFPQPWPLFYAPAGQWDRSLSADFRCISFWNQAPNNSTRRRSHFFFFFCYCRLGELEDLFLSNLKTSSDLPVQPMDVARSRAGGTDMPAPPAMRWRGKCRGLVEAEWTAHAEKSPRLQAGGGLFCSDKSWPGSWDPVIFQNVRLKYTHVMITYNLSNSEHPYRIFF